MTYLAQMDTHSLEAALFRARPRHAEPKRGWSMVWAFLVQEDVNAEVNMAMKTMCAFQNPALFFSTQTSQDGPIVKWLLELRKIRAKGLSWMMLVRTWALITAKDRGGAGSLGCCVTIMTACGRGLASHQVACTMEGASVRKYTHIINLRVVKWVGTLSRGQRAAKQSVWPEARKGST